MIIELTEAQVEWIQNGLNFLLHKYEHLTPNDINLIEATLDQIDGNELSDIEQEILDQLNSE